MKPSTFFAIYIPIFTTLICTLYIIYTKDKKPNPKMNKVLYSLAAVGLLVFIIFFVGRFMWVLMFSQLNSSRYNKDRLLSLRHSIQPDLSPQMVMRKSIPSMSLLFPEMIFYRPKIFYRFETVVDWPFVPHRFRYF